MNIRDSGNRHNGSHGRRFDGNLAQSVEFIQLAHLHSFLLFRFMMVYNHDLLAFGDDAVIHFAYTDTPHIFVIIDSAHKQLRPCVRIPFGSRNIIQDSIEKRLHILILYREVQSGASCLGGSEHKRTVQLFVIGIQIHEKLQNLIHNSDGPCLRTVNLIHTHNNGKLQLQSLAQHEFCLGHRAFKSIHHQNNPVHHFKNTFHFTAEIRMSGGINNIDLSSFIRNGRIFGKNGNTSFPLNSIGVHDPLRHILVFPENTALLQKLIHQSCFTVVNVSDNSHISHIFSFLNHTQIPFLYRLFRCCPAQRATGEVSDSYLIIIQLTSNLNSIALIFSSCNLKTAKTPDICRFSGNCGDPWRF